MIGSKYSFWYYMAEIDTVIIDQIKELLQASGEAKQKGLASQATLKMMSDNIAAMAKQAGVKGATAEARKKQQAESEAVESIEAVNEAAKKNTSSSISLTKAFDEVRFSGVLAKNNEVLFS